MEDTCRGAVNNFLQEVGSFVEMTALKPSLWHEGWPILHDVGSHTHSVNFKLIIEEQTCTDWVCRSWWSHMYTAHAPPWLLCCWQTESLCPPASITDQIHKASARRCSALLNVVLFHYLLAENSSLIISYPFSQPASLQSLHYFPGIGFLFYFFYY